VTDKPESDPVGLAFALLDAGYSKESAAALSGLSIEVLDAEMERLHLMVGWGLPGRSEH
jgi:hypothetical protein